MTQTKDEKAAQDVVAFVDERGTFHCPNGHQHSRGPINGVDIYRCLSCGSAWQVQGVVELRRVPQ
jgi:hypothetical protein